MGDWVCSGCGRHYSWAVTECYHCQPVTTITTGGTQPTANNSAMVEICADYKSSAYCIWQPTYMRCGVVPCKKERKLRQ